MPVHIEGTMFVSKTLIFLVNHCSRYEDPTAFGNILLIICDLYFSIIQLFKYIFGFEVNLLVSMCLSMISMHDQQI